MKALHKSKLPILSILFPALLHFFSSQTGFAQTSVVAWGQNNSGDTIIPTNLTNVVAIAGGQNISVALKADGTVTAWGNINLTNGPSGLSNVVSIAAGGNFILALRNDGTMAAWGASTGNILTAATNLTGITAIAAGDQHALALRANRTVFGWGDNSFNETNVPTGLTNVVAISAGGYSSFALLGNGTVVAWGNNSSGQANVPAGLSNVTAIAAGFNDCLALKSNGTIVGWGNPSYTQTNVSASLSNIVAIASGYEANLALRSNGTVFGWGQNVYGQTNVPSNLSNIVSIAAGYFHALALVSTAPPIIQRQPQSQTVYENMSAQFQPQFLSPPPTTFQWQFNGTNIPGANNPTLSLSGLQTNDTGNYDLVISNGFGSAVSSNALLTVLSSAPIFISQPTNVMLLPGSNAVFTSTATGSQPINYQWYFNGSQISGATNTSLSLTNIQTTNAGNYSLVAANAVGTNTSSNAALIIVGIPEALGPTNLTWSNPSHPAWFVETSNTLDGFAVEVGPMQYGQQSLLQTTVSGPGTLTFHWKTPSSSASLSFLLDGTTMASSGNTANNSWISYAFYLSSGVHALSWNCVNNWSPGSTGVAYLDEASYTPGGTAAFITSQPASQTNHEGTNVTLSVGESGTPPFTNQWYFNGAPLPGATGASLTLTSIQSSNAGIYNLVVSNGYGSANSSNASLVVLPSAPIFTTQPVNTESLLGGQASFSASAQGTAPVTYQWYLNGGPVPGATATSIIITNVQYANGGTYYLLASNVVGTAVSSNANLLAYSVSDLAAAMNNTNLTWGTTNVPWFPETNITHSGVSAAQSGVISGSQQSTLQASVTGPATLTYWWQVNCDSFWDALVFALDGTNQNSITGNVSWQPATNYLPAGTNVVAWSLYPVHGAFAGGTGWVDQVQVSFGGTAPFITANPSSSTNSAGATATFSATAQGTPPMLYQWQFNGTNLPGANSSALSLVNVQSNNAGTYSAIISNAFGFAVTSNAVLVVNPSGPTITQQPASQTAALNSTVSFTVAPQGSAPISYLWQFNGSPLPNATSSSLTIANVQSNNAGAYQVLITNNYGSVTSSVALLDVGATIVIDVTSPYNPFISFSTVFGVTNLTAVAAGASHSLGLRPDGTVLAWGNNSYGQTNVPAGLSNVVAVAAGARHSEALKSDGTVVAWGDNTYGQLLVPTGLSNVTRLATSSYYTLALKNDGTIVGWGNNSSGQLDVPAGLTNVQDIAAGYYNGFALNADGTVTVWGNGPSWQSNGSNTQLSADLRQVNIDQVVAGAYSAWTLGSSGLVKAWGFDAGPEIGVAMALAGNGDSPLDDYVLYLQGNGQVLQFPSPNFNNGISNVVAMSAGPSHAVLLVNDGAPVVVRQLFNQTTFTGSTVLLSPGLVGAPNLTYQWQFNGTNLPSATNGYLPLINVSFTNAGSYTCTVSNAFGTAATLPATLTVLRSTPSFNVAAGGLQLTTNGFSLQLSGLSGHGDVVLYFSTDLQNWTPILTNAPVVGTLQLLDPNATNFSKGFYRAVEQ